jgi:hypothetical protein
MRHLVDAVRRSVREQNWYAALTLALTLPDIAAKIDGKLGGSESRYVAWFNDYLLSRYTGDSFFGPRAFLTGNDCYALRCAFLHAGDFDITGQRARKILEYFRFTVPVPTMLVHRNQIDQTLQLQIDIFAEDVCVAVEDWLRARSADTSVAMALAGMPQITSNLSL